MVLKNEELVFLNYLEGMHEVFGHEREDLIVGDFHRDCVVNFELESADLYESVAEGLEEKGLIVREGRLIGLSK